MISCAIGHNPLTMARTPNLPSHQQYFRAFSCEFIHTMDQMEQTYHVTVPHRHQHHHEGADHGDSVSLLLPFVSSGIEAHHTIHGMARNYTTGYDQTVIASHSWTNPSVLPSPRDSYIDKLPFEVRLAIANELTQYDSLSLMRVNRAFFESTVVRLYHTVVVDPIYSYFNQDVLGDSIMKRSGVTYIKMKYSLKTFLKTVSLQTPIKVSDFGREDVPYSIFINKLQFVELPDGFYSPFDLNFFAFMSIKKLERLTRFYWGSNKELSFEIINRLPNKQYLRSLHVNVDFRRLQSPSEFEAFKGFNNLEMFSIEQFLTSDNLFHMFSNLIQSDEGLSRLKILRLSRMDSSRGFIKNLSSSMLVLTSYMIENEPVRMTEYDMKCIENLHRILLANNTKLKELKVLSLDSVLLSSDDASRLSRIIDLHQLEQLELKNTTEVQFPPGVTLPLSMNELYAKLNPGFLRSLGQRLQNVTKLCVDYREGLRDSVPDFIERLDNLEELDVTIRWNVTKLCSVASWKHLCQSYIRSILKHSHTLRRLSLETKEDSVFCDLHKLIYTDCLLKLGVLTQLESLRLHGYSLQPCAALLVSSLPRLQYYELFGSSAGGAPHMGQQVVHDGVLDDWLRVRHVASEIFELNAEVKFVKIEKCLFQNQGGNAVPRDGLDQWFERKVRVGVDQDNSN